ncbi:MAG TPA: DNA polymerase III subunit alpha [Gemmatimonadaceae bacterium]|nr:DNA polymerase III subunit alpha [Gemmatimonadaceae bacterium]
MSFAHLHCHSEFSLLDGANRLDDLITRARDYEQPALAITDHGNLFGAWEFQEKAKRAGIKPIIGMEAYVAPGDRRTRGRSGPWDKPYFHLVLLARDNVGYRNLVKLSSLGYTEGFYTRPRIDRALLEQYGEGLIVSSACMAGEIAQHLMTGDTAGAAAVAKWYAERFPDRYYLEVQAHQSEGQALLNERVFALARELNLPVIATNDSHFLTAESHDAHDVLLCIGLGKDRADPDRMRYDRGLYFKNADEIAAAFPSRPDVLENTVRIADECNIELTKQFCVPSFPLPPDVASENDLLVRLANAGARERYGDPLPDEVRERLNYELGVITTTGYSGYFLIVADFIKAARDRGIPVGPGRGSSAGSLVAYSLRITDLDPLKYDLVFERFLNPERVAMPDIDVDFCFERRGEVIEYVREKYGKNAVGQIVTFGTLKSRAAIKDVGRVLGFTPAETDALAKLIPNQPNYSLTVREAVAQIADVKRLYRDDERYRQLLDYAIALEGLSRHTGVHAAGVVIAPGPLDDYVPICTQTTKGAGSTGTGSEEEIVVVTQYDMNALEKAGMLKIDFLGLTTLTVIHDTLEAIGKRGHKVPDFATMAYDDDATFHMLRTGRTVGVFQFESPLATDLLRGMRCDRFDDLVVSNGLMRPGPLDAGMHKVYMRRKRGEEPVSYPLPELRPILEPTFGVITYQEQVMRVAQVLAGISLGEADVLRKAVGKKDAELIKQELGKFTEKAVARGYDRRVIDDIAAQIETFGRYGFPKAHSVAYSVIGYQTAYLKCHHPAEFMAAMLSSSIGNTDNVVKYINEGRDLDLQILPPDVNESGYKFTVVGDKRVRFGLGAIRNVGRAAIDSILAARAERPFTSLYDLCERVDLRLCNKRVFEALIHSGAVDALGGHRAQYAAALDTALHEASLKQAERESGQGSLFGDVTHGADASTNGQTGGALPNVAPYTESERLAREKEILGFYTSGHPLEPFTAECALFATHTVSQLGTWTEGQMKLGVVITAIKRQVSKSSGAEFARLTVEDFSGSSEVLVFADRWAVLTDKIRTDIPVLLTGGYSRRDRGQENATFIIESVQRFEELRLDGKVKVAIQLRTAGARSGGSGERGVESTDASSDPYTTLMRDIRQVIDAHPGSASIEVCWSDSEGHTGDPPVRFRSRSLSMAASPAALNELRALLGHDQVKLERSNGGSLAGNGSGGGGR